MTRIAVIAGLASTVALVMGTLSAQAAPLVRHGVIHHGDGIHAGRTRHVEVVRYHRPYVFHRYHRSYRYFR